MPNEPTLDPVIPVTPAVPTKPWYEGKLDSELIGHLQNRGLADKPLDEVATNLLKGHLEAQRLLTTDPKNILKLPTKPDDKAGWDAIYQRLGAPAKPEEYKFDGIKFADGTDLDEAFIAFAREQAANLHLSVDGARAFTQALVKKMDADETTENADKTAKLTAAKAALQKNWGQNFEANKFVASQAATKLGMSASEIAGLEGVVGYDRIMEMFRTVGEQMGEAIFVKGNNPGGGGIMTREQAVAKKAELMADAAWTTRYTNGGKVELNEMMALSTIISGGQVNTPTSQS
jgi:hypothetical protein